MTEKEDKGNGEPAPSRIVIEFTGPALVDRINIDVQGTVTPGQFHAATLQLFFMAGYNVFAEMTAQTQKRMQEQAMMQSIIKGAK